MAKGYRASSWANTNILKLIVIDAQLGIYEKPLNKAFYFLIYFYCKNT